MFNIEESLRVTDNYFLRKTYELERYIVSAVISLVMFSITRYMFSIYSNQRVYHAGFCSF